MDMKIGVKIFKQLLKSGEAIGGEMKLTQITEAMAKHPSAIGEQIGNMLGGKGKDATKLIDTLGGFEALTTKLNELAQKHPEAVVKLGIKQSKQGYTVVSTTVKNSEKVLFKGAGSVTKNAEGIAVKSRVKTPGSEYRSFADSKGNIRSEAENHLTKVTIDGTVNDMQVTLGKEGEVATARIKRTAKGATKAAFESEGDLAYVNAQKNGISMDAVIDKAKAKDLIQKTVEEEKAKARKILESLKDAAKSGEAGDSGKPMSIALRILRPLRDRLNTAVDLFKYNGHTNFERFLSKNELKSEIEKMTGEREVYVKKIKNVVGKDVDIEHVKFNKLPKEIRTDFEYLKQLDSDIECGRRLIRITC